MPIVDFPILFQFDVECKDGTLSYSVKGCDQHGGLADVSSDNYGTDYDSYDTNDGEPQSQADLGTPTSPITTPRTTKPDNHWILPALLIGAGLFIFTLKQN